MTAPNYFGLHLPCRFVRVRDADTVEISIPGSDRIWPIRLIDCWAPENNTPEGQKATEYLADRLTRCKGSVLIPLPSDPLKITKMMSFDRVLAHLFCDGKSVADDLISKGYATRHKGDT